MTYTSNNNNVSIIGNKIYGNVANSSAKITATSEKGTTATFTINVGSDNMFKSVFGESFLPYFQESQDRLQNRNDLNKNDLTLYIGDSFFDRRNFFTSAFNAMYSGANAESWGICSSLAKQWIWFIQKAYAYQPKNIVIHIGTNDIFDTYGPNGSNLVETATIGSANYNTVVNNVTELLKTLFNNIHANLPETNVYWYSIEPRLYGNTNLGNNGNAIARAVNSNILNFANSNNYLTYLDSCTILQNDKSLYVDDVHPNVVGYLKMSELLPAYLTSVNTNYTQTISNFTHNYSSFGKSTIIDGSYGDFVYTSEITVESFSNNAHITLNFNHNDKKRFLLWNNENNGKFWFGGIFDNYVVNGGNGAQSYIDAKATPITFKLAILSKNKVQYLFIEDQLVATYNNGFTPVCLTVGAESCNVSFKNNVIAHNSTAVYTTYSNKIENLVISTGISTIADKSIVNAATSVQTIQTLVSDKPSNKSKEIVSSASTFLFTGKIDITQKENNPHISLSIGNDHDKSYRFLIWDQDNNGSFYFGWGPNYKSTSKGYFEYPTTKTLNVAVLSTTKNVYLFVNGALQTVFAGKGNCTLLYATEGMQTTLSNGLVYPENSAQYTKYIEVVSSYENTSYNVGEEIDIGGEVVLDGYISDFTQSSGNAVIDAKKIDDATGSFVFESTITINSFNNNAHISLNFISSTNTKLNRFLIWNNINNGQFYFGGCLNNANVTGLGSVNASSTPKTFNIAVYTKDKTAYLFIDGQLKSVMVLDFVIEGFSFGAESCSVTFSNNSLSNTYTKTSTYSSYVNNSEVANYSSKGYGFYDHTNGGAKLV